MIFILTLNMPTEAMLKCQNKLQLTFFFRLLLIRKDLCIYVHSLAWSCKTLLNHKMKCRKYEDNFYRKRSSSHYCKYFPLIFNCIYLMNFIELGAPEYIFSYIVKFLAHNMVAQ